MRILTSSCKSQYFIEGVNYYIRNDSKSFSLMKKGSNVPFQSSIEKFCIKVFRTKAGIKILFSNFESVVAAALSKMFNLVSRNPIAIKRNRNVI